MKTAIQWGMITLLLGLAQLVDLLIIVWKKLPCRIWGHRWHAYFLHTECRRCGRQKGDRLWQMGYGKGIE